MTRGREGIVSVLLALAISAGCAGGGMPHPAEPPQMDKPEYVIGAGDVLRDQRVEEPGAQLSKCRSGRTERSRCPC